MLIGETQCYSCFVLRDADVLPLSSSIRTKDFLYIVLELVENGSLAAAIKRFGYFDEQLTAVYIAQVLRGLAYLVSSPGRVWNSSAATVLTPVAHPDVSTLAARQRRHSPR